MNKQILPASEWLKRSYDALEAMLDSGRPPQLTRDAWLSLLFILRQLVDEEDRLRIGKSHPVEGGDIPGLTRNN